eukprot:9470390-Pyramimonas_sp.AAC.1
MSIWDGLVFVSKTVAGPIWGHRSGVQVALQSIGSLGLWNAMTTKQHQLVGKRAVALKLLFEVAPRAGLESILEHVGSMGWGSCVWTEDVLASKKNYPNHQFASKSKKWTARVKTSEESFLLMVERAQNSYEMSNPNLRWKLTPANAEALAERASACLAMAAELQLQVPIPEQKIKDAFIEQWRMGSEHVDFELQAALMDKSDTFDVAMHMPTLKKLVDEHVFSTPVSLATDAQQALDSDQFHLLIKQLEYDTTCYENWMKKCSGVVCARYHREQETGLFWPTCLHDCWFVKHPGLCWCHKMYGPLAS